MTPVLIFLIILALGFDFLNGIHGSSTIVATMISSRALKPRTALIIIAVAEFCGPFIFGVAVANTIGSQIVSPQLVNMNLLLAALLAAIIWNVFTWALGIPSNSSYALIGGLIGAVMVGTGWQGLIISGLVKIFVSLFASPLLGFLAGWLIANLIFLLSWKATPRINGIFKQLQVATSLGLALSHGTNDAQKAMGVITLGLVIGGFQEVFQVPFWVVFICALVIATGTAIGGWRLIRTLGSKFYKIRPVHGLASQVASAMVILTASLVGGPVSTTQVVSTSIMGVGAAERLSKVRWNVAGEILSAWLLTIPATALLAAGLYWLIDLGIPGIIGLFLKGIL